MRELLRSYCSQDHMRGEWEEQWRLCRLYWRNTSYGRHVHMFSCHLYAYIAILLQKLKKYFRYISANTLGIFALSYLLHHYLFGCDEVLSSAFEIVIESILRIGIYERKREYYFRKINRCWLIHFFVMNSRKVRRDQSLPLYKVRVFPLASKVLGKSLK
jgi:hypothetical protein